MPAFRTPSPAIRYESLSPYGFRGNASKVLGLYLERPREKAGPGLLWWALQIQRLEGSLSGCRCYGLSMELS
jgi:hypothetical protein